MDSPAAAPVGPQRARGQLTAREMDILVCSAAGKSASQTARSLNISRRTVEYHLTEMLRRTGSQNSVELVARCYAAGILVPGIWPPQWSGQLCLASGGRRVAGQAGARANPG